MARLDLLGTLVKILGERSGIGKASVWHAVIVTFLHYFSWGLLTVPFIEKLSASFGNRVLLVDGLVYGLRGILGFVTTPVMGAVSDFRGRKVVMLLAVATTYSPIPFMMIKSWWFFALLALSSICGSTYSSSLAYVSDVTSVSDRSKGYGIVAASFGAGIAFSPLLGNYLMKSFGSGSVIMIATITGLINILFIIFGVPESLIVNDISLVLDETDDWSQRLDDDDVAKHISIVKEECQLENIQEKQQNEEGYIEIFRDNDENLKNKPILELKDEEPTQILNKNGKIVDQNKNFTKQEKILNPYKNEHMARQTEDRINDNTKLNTSDLWAVLRRSRKDKNLMVIYLITFLSCWAFAGVDSTAPVYLKTSMGFEYEEVSMMLGLLSVIAVSSNLLLGYIMNLVGAKWLIRLGLLLLLSQLIFFAFATQHWIYWMSSIMAAMATIIPAANNAVASIYASPENQGAVLGIISGIECLSEGVGPAFFGVLFYIFQDDSKDHPLISPIPVPFVISAIGVFVAIILTGLIKKENIEKEHKMYKTSDEALDDEDERRPLTKAIFKDDDNGGYIKLDLEDYYDSDCKERGFK
ncbi:hippocampus abundant transcript-like protein 1 [Drosophila eugracilis]|uniref:hippocampus abundant transcript-like protein 1 n=1 Tax=Drosophila eugracilis TaxID=29029 RepID=UPI0007E6EB9A|nr:hippocampus abundant transcript-like protein 1 [Drosophila eugracilis]